MAEVSLMRMTVDLEPVQLVAPDGTPTTEVRYSRELPAETLCWLYEMMVVTRDVDAEFVNLQRQGELALFASCCGQEAAQVGAAACLRKTDWLFPQYRELGVYLVRGIAPGQVGEARAGTLKPVELAGSTFTVSNFGALGLDEGVPVINHPEAAILGMGSLKPRPMVLDDTVVVRPQMTLTCVFDHRVADGANVAQFLGELRRLIESPETALLDL